MKWTTPHTPDNSYAFTYDGVNRLTGSLYSDGSTFQNNRYTEQLTYDKNGNITALQRYGDGLIDSLTYAYYGNQPTQITDAATAGGFPFGATAYAYDASGNTTAEGSVAITYNLLNLPQEISLLGGRSIQNTYATGGRKLKTVTADNTEYTDGTKTYNGNLVFDKNNELEYILFDEGRILYNVDDSSFNFEYHLRDHLGSTRVAFVPAAQSTEVVQENNYYPFGAPISDLSWSPKSTNRYLREGKEYISDFDWNKYDFTGRTFDSWTLRALQVDIMAEKYSNVSPYALWIGNPIRIIDPTGMDWYQNNETMYYTWYNGNKEREGYTYIGEKGSVLGEFESIIDDLLTGIYKTESMFSEGFTFDIVPNDKGALIGSKERDWDFLDEFVYGTGPEFSVFLSDHPYTKAMKEEKKILKAQQDIANGVTDVSGQITNVSRKWYPWNVFMTTSVAKQFIGSYRFDAFTSQDGTHLNNVISDSKSMYSLFLHGTDKTPRRSERKDLGNTYQFYIWQSLKK
jgi:RHS repeat-associated protein